MVVEPATEVDATSLVDVGPDETHHVPAALGRRILDPDHLGAEHREHLRRARPGELPTEVADADVAESAHRDQSRGLSKKFG